MIVETGVVSLMTISWFLNVTSMNQGNHCIIAFNQKSPAFEAGNQELVGNPDICGGLAQTLHEPMQAMATRFFTTAAIGGA